MTILVVAVDIVTNIKFPLVVIRYTKMSLLVNTDEIAWTIFYDPPVCKNFGIPNAIGTISVPKPTK